MKTHILRLEIHDDVISARDKMGWGETGRILLVWPARGRVLTRRLDLVLLYRHSVALGSQLALVTQDPEVYFHACQLSIPVFKSIRRAQSALWRVSRHERRKQFHRDAIEHGRARASIRAGEAMRRPLVPVPGLPLIVRLAIFTAGILALFSMAAALLPSAELTINPKRQVQEISFDVQAAPQTQAIHLSGLLPSQIVHVIVEGRDSQPTSGSMRFPSHPASGMVTFTNLSDQPVLIPRETIVSTPDEDPVRFATVQAGTVPAGAGQTRSLPVLALTSGSLSNLPTGRLQAVLGPLGTEVTVTNNQSMSGGRDRQDKAPNTADRRRLSDRLLESLRQTALEELRKGLTEGDLLVESSLSLQRILDETYDPAGVEPADQLFLSLRLEFQVMVISGKDLRSLAAAVLDANLPSNYRPASEYLEVENVDEPKLGNDSITRWKLHARRQILAQFPSSQAVGLSLGLAPQAAEQRLAAALPLEKAPRIALTPAWWPRLPIVPFRISITSDQ